MSLSVAARYERFAISEAREAETHNVCDDPVAASKLNIKTDDKCDLGPSLCYSTIYFQMSRYSIKEFINPEKVPDNFLISS